MKFKVLFLISIFLILGSRLNAASPKDFLNVSNSFYSNKLCLYSTFVSQNKDNDSLKLYIFYKLPLNNYLFVQSNKGSYFASYTLEVSFADVDGVVRLHKIITDTISSPKPQENTYNFNFREGFFEFDIPNLNYNLSVRAIDNNTKNQEKTNLIYLNKTTTKNKVNEFSYLFTEKDANNNYSPIILNNALNFSANPIRIYFSLNPKFVTTANKIQIKKIQKEESNYWANNFNYDGNLIPAENNSLSIIDKGNNQITVEVAENTETKVSAGSNFNENPTLFYLDFPNNDFVPGEYEVKITNNWKDTLVANINCVWDDEPLSLKNLKFAQQISRIFLNEDEMDKITSGDNVESFQNLIKVWEKFNPNPKVVYNDVMVQFYKRVDFAYFNYSTFSERNGAASDKGKIYILYGKPDNIKQAFRNGKLYEIWTYEKLIKEFSFESVDSGIFKLVDLKQ
jgi:GWxTD domain-containing protein